MAEGPTQVTPIDKWAEKILEAVANELEMVSAQQWKDADAKLKGAVEGIVGEIVREALQVAGYICQNVSIANSQKAAELNAAGEYPYHTVRFEGAAEVAGVLAETLKKAGAMSIDPPAEQEAGEASTE